jgi:hypothetical protein
LNVDITNNRRRHSESQMPALKTYDLFISHAWAYNDAYYRLQGLLQAAPYFQFRNYSVPTHDPLVDPGTLIGKARLTQMLDAQIRPVNCVLVIAGMYATHKYWIQKEIELAQSYRKPIIGLVPWDQERVPLDVQLAASEMASWSTSSIVDAIRRWSI